MFRKQINCKTIHFIYGNHDLHIRKNYNEAHSLFSSTNDLLHKSIGKDNFVFCHYSMRTWLNGSEGAIMLYGHSHGTLEEYKATVKVTNEKYGIEFDAIKPFKTMDVGIDTHPEFRPYNIEEIREIMSHRINLHVDHHINNRK